MHKNPIWLGLVTLILLVTLFFSVKALSKIRDYSALDSSVQAEILKWSVEEKSSERYLLNVDYSFPFAGKVIHDSETWRDLSFRNPWAAQQHIEQMQKSKILVHFDASNPSHSSLQRPFPLRESIYALVMIGLLAYFIALGYYVGQMGRK